MVASSLCSEKNERTTELRVKGGLAEEKVGGDAYQQTHMALIFQEGLSFSGYERNKTFISRGDGTWADLSAVSGADTDADCRATIAADFDDDGDADIFVNAAQKNTHFLYRNDAADAATSSFVKVRLRATKGHPDAIGAIVTLSTAAGKQTRVLSCGTGFESQEPLEIVFGLGAAKSGRLSVRWPGRASEDFGDVTARSRSRLVEGTGKAAPIEPRPFTFADPGATGVQVSPGDSLSALTVTGFDGKPGSVTFDGEKKWLVNFWSIDCPTCLREMPILRDAHAGEYNTVAICLDDDSKSDRAKRFTEKFAFGFPFYRMDEKGLRTLFDIEKLVIPVSLIVSPGGRIDRVIQGKIHASDL